MSVRQTVTIVNTKGLHARAAAKFVHTAGRFDCYVTVHKDGETVSGISIMGLMMLAAGPGSKIEIEVTGNEAQDALSALVDLIENEFEEA